MRRPLLLAALAAAAATTAANATAGSGRPDQAPVALAGDAVGLPSLPPPARFPQDPADSLYRAARSALNQNDYRAAARGFRQIVVRHPRSAYAPDALYWEAFALYRMGGSENLRTALDRLGAQRRDYPRAGTRADASALATRIRGALAQLGDAGAAQAVTRQAAQAARSCPRGDDDMRTAALNALMNMNAGQAVPVLRQVLARRDACSVPLREKAVFILSQHGGPETADVLLGVARDDPSAEVREKAVFWLSEIPSDRAVALLEQILRSSSDLSLREKAIFALSQHDSPRATELLRAAAEQRSLPAELREKAIFWLHDQDTPENAAFLRGLYARLDSRELREKVLFSLAEMGGTANQSWLIDLASNAREPVELRKKALFWASESGVSVDHIAELYDRAPDRALREQAVFTLSQRGERAAVDKLISIARSERDPELRKKAIFWLSESDDPRAAQVLMEIVGH
jgi:HEAT repeat protein